MILCFHQPYFCEKSHHHSFLFFPLFPSFYFLEFFWLFIDLPRWTRSCKVASFHWTSLSYNLIPLSNALLVFCVNLFWYLYQGPSHLHRHECNKKLNGFANGKASSRVCALFFSSLQPRITEFENHGIQRWEISSSLTNTYKFFLTFSQDELIQEMFDAIFLQSKKLLYHGMWPMRLHILECLQNNFRFFIELFLICRP